MPRAVTRTVTGERLGHLSRLYLSEVISDTLGVRSEERDVLDFFLKVRDVLLTFQATSESPASCKALDDFISGLLQGYLKNSEDIPLALLQGMITWVQGNFRLKNNFDFASLRFLDTSSQTYVDVNQKFESLEIAAGTRRAPIQFFNSYDTLYNPHVNKTIITRSTHTPFLVENHNHFHLTRNSSGSVPEYLLSADSLGVIALMKDGVAVSSVSCVPSPLNQQDMILTSYGSGMHWENPGAHTASHGITQNSGGGSNDGVLASLDFLSDSGKIRVITTTQVTVTTPQTLDDRYYTRDSVDNLLTPLTTQIASLQAQVAVMSFQLSTVQGSLPQVRINGVLEPLKRLSFDSASVSTVYTNSLGHVHVWVTGPPVDPPS